MRWLAAFAIALAVATVCGTAASTHFVLEALEATGVEIPLGDRIDAFGNDLVGLGPTYAAVVAPALLVFLAAGSRLRRRLGVPAVLASTLAGLLALGATMALMPLVFGTMPISGARSAAGLAAQVGAGGLAGLAFGLARGTPVAATRRGPGSPAERPD